MRCLFRAHSRCRTRLTSVSPGSTVPIRRVEADVASPLFVPFKVVIPTQQCLFCYCECYYSATVQHAIVFYESTGPSRQSKSQNTKYPQKNRFLQQSGVTGGASSCDSLPPAEGREYNKALEEEWGNRAVSALREPLPSPSPSPSPDTKAAAAAAAGTAAAEVEAGVSGDEVRAGASEGEVSLLLACLCRGLETTFVVRVPEILGRCGRVWWFRGMLVMFVRKANGTV